MTVAHEGFDSEKGSAERVYQAKNIQAYADCCFGLQGKRMKHFTPPESRQGSFHPVPLASVCAGCCL